jgi:hypothetical protein
MSSSTLLSLASRALVLLAVLGAAIAGQRLLSSLAGGLRKKYKLSKFDKYTIHVGPNSPTFFWEELQTACSKVATQA